VSDRNTLRHRLKRTVEQVVPSMDIDATRVLSDEEIEELHRQTEERVAAVRLASKEGRAGLMDRLKRTMMKLEDEEEKTEE
jgi:two-component sensor histidine kinase